MSNWRDIKPGDVLSWTDVERARQYYKLVTGVRNLGGDVFIDGPGSKLTVEAALCSVDPSGGVPLYLGDYRSGRWALPWAIVGAPSVSATLQEAEEWARKVLEE